ncbi:caspase family protein [Dactylosporangium sp. CA-139066]|uniref:caspase family protein n=1 Tax=Dactylosporangium sp. CA-139066 TaxID=3239930 RepID=UPI003D8E727E
MNGSTEARARSDAHYAVVVGINRYPGLGDLHGPVDDAGRFHEWLVDPDGGGLPERNVWLVPASSDAEDRLTTGTARPALGDINDALRDVNAVVRRRAAVEPTLWDRTRLYLFVAGHGLLPGDGEGALLAANASGEEPGYNLDLRLYKEWYRRCGLFRELVVFADCCRNDFPGATSYGPPFLQCSTVERDVRLAIGYGAAFGGRAYEGVIDGESLSPSDRRGLFTTALLRALRRHRRWDEVRALVNQTLAQLAEERRRDQRAEMAGDDDIVFGRPGAPPPDDVYQVTIVFPAGAPEAVEVCDGRLAVIGSWDTRQGPWRRGLPPGLYYVRGRDGGAAVGAPFVVAGADVDVKL